MKSHIGKHVRGGGKKCGVPEVGAERCGLENHWNLVNGVASAFQCLRQEVGGGQRVLQSQITRVSEDVCLSVSRLNNVVRGDRAVFQQKAVPGETCASESQMNDATPLSFAGSLAHGVVQMPVPERALSASAASNAGRVDERRVLLRLDDVPVARRAPRRGRAGAEAATATTGGRPGVVTCAECWRTFRRLPDLDAHLRCHTAHV